MSVALVLRRTLYAIAVVMGCGRYVCGMRRCVVSVGVFLRRALYAVAVLMRCARYVCVMRCGRCAVGVVLRCGRYVCVMRQNGPLYAKMDRYYAKMDRALYEGGIVI